METKTLNLPNHLLIPQVKQLIEKGHTVTLRVKGHSMRIFLKNNRDLATLAPIKPEELKVGQVVLAEVAPNCYVLHRIIKLTPTSLTLLGDGNVNITEKCRPSDVIAVATAFYRKGRTTPDLTTGLKWRIYSKIWKWLTPFRRIILGVYSRLF